MNIILYKTKSEKDSLEKNLTDGKTLSGHLVAECSLEDPVFKIDVDTSLFKHNYVYIPDFARYYFITDITVTGKCMIVSCHCDVLKTYSSEIKQSSALINRSSKGNRYLVDPMIVQGTKTKIETRKLGGTVPMGDSYILIVGGV